MRRALGLVGDGPRVRPETGERSETPQRQAGNFTQGAHRRRFVQDGEIPVTVIRRDEAPGAAPAMGPSFSRLHRVETALQGETAARERIEKALQDAQATVQALRTKMGHNELEKNEAIESARTGRATVAGLREEVAALTESLREAGERASEAEEALRATREDLAGERSASRAARRLAEDTARQPLLALETAGDRGYGDTPVRPPARRGRPPGVSAAPPPASVASQDENTEGEPVKWWLMPAKPAGKRR